jgi:hypothetical protein
LTIPVEKAYEERAWPMLFDEAPSGISPLLSPNYVDVLKKFEWIFLLVNRPATVEVRISFIMSNSI